MILSDNYCCSHIVEHCDSGVICHSYFVWGPLFNPCASDISLFNAHGRFGAFPVVLHSWCVEQGLAWSPERAGPFRRSIRRFNGGLPGSLARCRPHSPGLGSWVAEVACDDTLWSLFRLPGWQDPRWYFGIWQEVLITLGWDTSTYILIELCLARREKWSPSPGRIPTSIFIFHISRCGQGHPRWSRVICNQPAAVSILKNYLNPIRNSSQTILLTTTFSPTCNVTYSTWLPSTSQNWRIPQFLVCYIFCQTHSFNSSTPHVH